MAAVEHMNKVEHMNETPEQREARLKYHREYHIKQMETRRAKNREYIKKRREAETPEQREARLAKKREYKRKRRQEAKEAKGGQANGS